MQFNKLMTVMVVSSALALSGCSAMGTAIKKRNLEVKTQMSETIWLEPSNNKRGLTLNGTVSHVKDFLSDKSEYCGQ